MGPLFALGTAPVVRRVVPTRILVLDAEPLIRWSLSAALAAEGFDPVAVSDAAAARRVAEEWPPPRVVVLDLGSSKAECLELLLAIRGSYPDSRFVVMSTARDPSVVSTLGGGVEFIHKPFDLNHVVRLVADLATRRSVGHAPVSE